MPVGVLLGLCAAFCQSLSYLFSGLFVRTFRSSTRVLLVQAHILMGVASAVLLVAVRPPSLPPLRVYIWPLLGGALFYLIGQVGLFMALRRTDASRVSPLLGMKLPILAGISVAFLGAVYSPTQWAAIILCLGAAFLLNRSGIRVSWQGLAYILVACLGYCLSDLNIRELVGRFRGAGLTLAGASIVGACLSYMLCGGAALVLLPTVPRRNRRMWWHAAPFAATWLGGMLFLFGCFGAIGVVHGNIVQSTRGLISVLVGALVARAGYVHLEQRISRGVLLRRTAAAVLMVVAIALFSKG